MSNRRSHIWTLALLVATTLPAAGRAQAADALFRGFEPSGDWLLVVDGRELPQARIYDSTRAQALLLLTSEFESPVLVDRAGRSVATLDLLKVAERRDGTIDLLADAVLAPAGTLEVRQNEGVFRLAGKSVAIRPGPWKLGPQNGPALLDSNAGYRWRASHFSPDAGAMARLAADAKGVRVLTFFGTWCPHCRENLPHLLAVERQLGGSGPRFDYYGLPSPFTGEPEAARWQVSGVPTAVVLIDGKEVGRIPASGWAHPESALVDLVGGVSGTR